MKSQRLRPHQSAILLATFAAVVLWAVPVVGWILRPLTYLNTHIHEMCHALMAQATGGSVLGIEVHADGSGVTPIAGGIMPLSAMAGYIGATLVGLAVIYASRTEEGARKAMRILAIVLGFGMVVWVRGDLVGIISGIGWVGALFVLANQLKGPGLLFAAQFLGVMQCANSVSSLFTLLQISAVTEAHSDAKLMEQMTQIPAIFWAVVWCLFSGLALFTGLRKAWSEPVRSVRPRG